MEILLKDAQGKFHNIIFTAETDEFNQFFPSAQKIIDSFQPTSRGGSSVSQSTTVVPTPDPTIAPTLDSNWSSPNEENNDDSSNNNGGGGSNGDNNGGGGSSNEESSSGENGMFG